MKKWTEKEIAYLIRSTPHLSASQQAKLLGRTRNSVIGKRHRLNRGSKSGLVIGGEDKSTIEFMESNAGTPYLDNYLKGRGYHQLKLKEARYGRVR